MAAEEFTMSERRDFDCIDFKLMLTSLVDGTAPPEGRRIAERHALDCPACLKLLEQAEATDFMLRLAARAEPAELSTDFADRVIAATRESGVADERAEWTRGGVRAGWREGVAWFAAAAAIVLAVVVWSSERREAWRGFRGDGSVTTIASPVFSGVRDLDEGDRRRAFELERDAARAGALEPLLRSLAEVVEEIVAADANDGEAILAIAARIRAEELATRAALLRISLPLDRRIELQAAEAALLGVTTGCLDRTRFEEMQSTLRSLDVAQRLRGLVRSLPQTLAAA